MHLYSLLAVGGILMLDDYSAWGIGKLRQGDQGVPRTARITSPIKQIDSEPVFWIKETR